MSINHFVVCLTTAPEPLPRRVLRRVRSSASSFNIQYPLLSISSTLSSQYPVPSPFNIQYPLLSTSSNLSFQHPVPSPLNIQYPLLSISSTLSFQYPVPSPFNIQYPLLSVSSSSSCLRLLPRLSVASNLPSIFPSITHFKCQFRRKMWPIQLAFPVFIVHRIFLLFVILLHFSRDQSNWSYSSLSGTTFQA
jgi:hypothetical protein